MDERTLIERLTSQDYKGISWRVFGDPNFSMYNPNISGENHVMYRYSTGIIAGFACTNAKGAKVQLDFELHFASHNVGKFGGFARQFLDLRVFVDDVKIFDDCLRGTFENKIWKAFEPMYERKFGNQKRQVELKL